MIRRIEREGGSRFQVYGQRNGKKAYVGTFDSKREAEAAERRHLVTQEQIAAGELPPEVDTNRTIKQGTELWLEALEAGKSRSHRVYGEFLRYQILPELGDVPIAKLTDARVRRWRDDLSTRYAPTSINSALGCLSSAFAYFVEQKWIGVNPCHGVKQADVPDRAYNWIKTRPELERLLLASSDDLRDMIAISIGTAMRIGELLSLQWDDIDLAGRLITIQRGGPGRLPKNGKIRHVPILDSVLPVLQQRALRRAGSVLVFPGKGGKHRAQTPVTCAYKAALRRAQMDTTLRWHDLRHTAASWWVLGGGDIFRLSKLMGHRDVKITQKTYAHLAPEAWQQDYGRLAFHVPSSPAKVCEFVRDDRGKLAGTRSVVIDARAAG